LGSYGDGLIDSEGLIPPGNLGRRIFHHALGRLQPARTVPVPISLARLRAMLAISRVASFTSSSFADAVETPFDQCR
jgi:hypothetical protein